MNEAAATGAAWARFAQRLAQLGDDLAAPPFPTGARETTEGYRNLSRLAVVGVQWALEFNDPDFPGFYRHDDDVTKWGGPNADNRYLRARVRGANAYRIVGNGSSSHGFLVSTHEGDMQLHQYGVYDEVWHDQLVTDEHGNFELVVGGERNGATNWIPLHPAATNITIREYFDDWARDEPGTFRIERIGGEGEPQPPITPALLAARLDEATEWVGESLHYWNRYMADVRAKVPANVLQSAGAAQGGANDIAYGFGIVELADDEAYLIEGDAPDAWFWNFLLYNDGWFESLDIANRPTSRNGSQMAIDADGRFRLVIAHADPGVVNWLDTTGLRATMLAYRYVRTATKPVPTGRVVKLAELAGALPADTRRCTPTERRAEIAVRQRHIARRFRN